MLRLKNKNNEVLEIVVAKNALLAPSTAIRFQINKKPVSWCSRNFCLNKALLVKNMASKSQLKLMEYYVQNPEKFKDDFGSCMDVKNNDSDHSDSEEEGEENETNILVSAEFSNHIFQFDSIFNPKRKQKDQRPIFGSGGSDAKNEPYLTTTKCFAVGPWKKSLIIELEFRQSSENSGIMVLDYELSFVHRTLEGHIKKLRVRINLSLANREDVSLENQWSDFNFELNGLSDETMSFDTARASDLNKLFTRPEKVIGKLTLYMVMSDDFLFKLRFQEEIGLNRFDNDEGDMFTIIAHSEDSHDQALKVDKNILMKISPVFKAMLENPNNKEVQNNSLILNYDIQNVVVNFCNLLSDGEFPHLSPTIYTNEFFHKKMYLPDLDLLMFADKFNIESLFKQCSRHIENHLSEKNAMKVLKVSDMVNNERLFLKAMNNFLSSKETDLTKYLLENPKVVRDMIASVSLW